MIEKFDTNWLFQKVGQSEIFHIDLPHDAMQFESRDSNNPSGSAGAYFAGGRYSYSKTFFANDKFFEKKVFFEFDGVYQNAKILMNGNEVGLNAYGYTPFFADVTEYINANEENTLTVEVDNENMPNSRWYTGSGIYRSVNLHLKNKNSIEINGLKISTLSVSPATIDVETKATVGDVEIKIFDGKTCIAKGNGKKLQLTIENALLWSADFPKLYEAVATLTVDGVISDRVVEKFGIRKITWNENGFFVNGENVLLKGGCVHHDNGILGARSYKKSEYRRVQILKDVGFNAIRSSHNPASKMMIEACDELGMYLIDESWDVWYTKKSKHDYSQNLLENFKKDISSMISRDFNHPCVIMYSLGNEIVEPSTDKGVEFGKKLIALTHSLDSTRPVTCGINLMIIDSAKKGNSMYSEDGGLNTQENKLPSSSQEFNMMTQFVGTGMNMAATTTEADEATSPILDALDIAGYNYTSGRYEMDGKLHPKRVIYGSETFPQDIHKNWALVKKLPYLIGDFMWTAWDHLGEVGLGGWSYDKEVTGFDKPYPWLLSGCGVVDILGNPDAEAFFAKTVWELNDKPLIAVAPLKHVGIVPKKTVWRNTDAIPSWSWSGRDGEKTVVQVFSNEKFIDLFLNEKFIEKKEVKDCKAEFEICFETGVLKAIAIDENGNKKSENELSSATGNFEVSILSEEDTIELGDICYVNINITGENGIVESNSEKKLRVSVENGELLGFGSGNPKTMENFMYGEYMTYYGRSQAVLKGTKLGKMKIYVRDEENQCYEAEITVK